MDNIKDYLKKVPMWGWIAIGGAFLLVAFLSSKKEVYTPAPTYSDGGGLESNKVSESEVANRIQSVVYELNQKFEERIKDQNEDFSLALQEKEAQRKAELDSLNQGWFEKLNALTSSFQEQNKSLTNQLGEVTQAVNEANQKADKVNQAYTVGLGRGTGESLGAYALRVGDKQLLQNEIIRAGSVVQYQKQNGMDSSLAEKYLNSLKGGK